MVSYGARADRHKFKRRRGMLSHNIMYMILFHVHNPDRRINIALKHVYVCVSI